MINNSNAKVSLLHGQKSFDDRIIKLLQTYFMF